MEKECDHKYIKAINYIIEDGVECRKCGKLWVPYKESGKTPYILKKPHWEKWRES